jgi:hypothetical protein
MPKERNKADGYREKAFEWYMKAAEKGDMQSQVNVGAAFWNGDGVEKNLEECAFWYELAANGGDAQSYTSCSSLRS